MSWTLALESQPTHTGQRRPKPTYTFHPCSTFCHASESALIVLTMPFEHVVMYCSSLMRRTSISHIYRYDVTSPTTSLIATIAGHL